MSPSATDQPLPPPLVCEAVLRLAALGTTDQWHHFALIRTGGHGGRRPRNTNVFRWLKARGLIQDLAPTRTDAMTGMYIPACWALTDDGLEVVKRLREVPHGHGPR